MELSTGGAVAGNTWQISASDLQYAWVAPPRDFVGSADLIAELRLPNAQIADRQTIRLEWTRPAAGSGPEPEPEHIAPGREIEATPPIPPAADQHPNDPDVVATAPQPTPSQDQFYRGREQSKSARAHGKNNLHRSVGVGSQPVPLASPPVRDSMHAPKGFWDWSRWRPYLCEKPKEQLTTRGRTDLEASEKGRQKIDKSAQRMTVAVDGESRWRFVSTGARRYDTPNGSYTAFRLEKDYLSKELDDAPMAVCGCIQAMLPNSLA
jgi:hypothetical protein